MTLIATVQASTSFVAQLVNPAARALILSVIAGGGLAAFRARSTSLRLFTWTAVLYGALAMPSACSCADHSSTRIRSKGCAHHFQDARISGGEPIAHRGSTTRAVGSEHNSIFPAFLFSSRQ